MEADLQNLPTMTNEKKAELGRPPAGTAPETDTSPDPGASTPSLFQHGFPPSAGGRREGVHSPIVDARGYPSNDNDAAITTKVREELQRVPMLRSAAIDCEAENGVVHLRGAVPSDEARRQVRTVVGRVDGVVEIHDHLELRSA